MDEGDGLVGISIGGVVPARRFYSDAVAVGPQGADQSTDDGRTWTPLPGASGLHTFAFAKQGRYGWGAGEKGRIMRLLY